MKYDGIICVLKSSVSYMAYLYIFGFFIPVYINIKANIGIVFEIREVLKIPVLKMTMKVLLV